MPPRWTDDRLDDLMALVKANDSRIDRLDRLVDKHDEALVDIGRTGERRRDNNRALYLVGFTVLTTSIANLILHLTHVA